MAEEIEKHVSTENGPVFGRVDETWERAIIVGGGPSVRSVRWDHFDIPPDVAVITVNQSVVWVPNPTHWITVDPSIQNRAGVMSNPRPGVRYYAAVPEGYGTPDAPVAHQRETPPEPHITFLRRAMGNGFIRAREGLSEDPTQISHGNSGYGALGLAYLMNARKIALLGIDGQGNYWFETNKTPGKMHHLPDLFASTVPQLVWQGIQVVNGSPDSTITCFPKLPPEAAIRWLLDAERPPHRSDPQ